VIEIRNTFDAEELQRVRLVMLKLDPKRVISADDLPLLRSLMTDALGARYVADQSV
jgi:hypothetical protein